MRVCAVGHFLRYDGKLPNSRIYTFARELWRREGTERGTKKKSPRNEEVARRKALSLFLVLFRAPIVENDARFWDWLVFRSNRGAAFPTSMFVRTISRPFHTKDTRKRTSTIDTTSHMHARPKKSVFLATKERS